MRKTVFSLMILAAAAPAPSSEPPAELRVRAVAWDYAWKPASDKEFAARVVREIAAAAKDGADAVVFPEQFSGGRSLEGLLTDARDAAGPDRLVVLGNAPYREPGKDELLSRAYILAGGAWQVMDKLDPTAAERSAAPPVKPGGRLPLFRFRGAVVAALPANSAQKPEIAATLKKRGVQLLLVSAPPADEQGAARLARCASARAAELGAAVVVAPPSSSPAALYLPAQKGFDLKPVAGRDFRLPWRKLLELRSRPEAGVEAPYLEPAPYYQTEI